MLNTAIIEETDEGTSLMASQEIEFQNPKLLEQQVEHDMLKVSLLEANEKQITEKPFKTDEELKAEDKSCFNFMSRLWKDYNHAFLASLGL